MLKTTGIKLMNIMFFIFDYNKVHPVPQYCRVLLNCKLFHQQYIQKPPEKKKNPLQIKCKKTQQLQLFTNDINITEYQWGNQKWTIQRNWEHRVHKTEKNKTKTQYVLDTTIRKQIQIT